jgi:hypothetical protein
MYPFDDWPQRISEEKNDGAIQSEIADKILGLLEQNKASLSAREKTLFAQAITGLSISVNSINQPAEAGLRRCLIALQKVTNPESDPDEPYVLRNNDGEFINYDMLVTTVEKIQEQISKKLANVDSRAFVE